MIQISVSFLLTLLKAPLSLDDVPSRAQFLCHFAQFCFSVNAIVPIILNNSDLLFFFLGSAIPSSINFLMLFASNI